MNKMILTLIFVANLCLQLNGQTDEILELLFPSEVVKRYGIKDVSVYRSSCNKNAESYNPNPENKFICKVYYDGNGNNMGMNFDEKKYKKLYKNIYDINKVLVYGLKFSKIQKLTYVDTTFYHYDDSGRIYKLIKQENGGKWVRERIYNEHSQLVSKIGYFVDDNNSLDSTTMIYRQYDYDDRGRISLIENLASNKRLVSKKEVYRDDNNRILLIVEDKHYLQNGQLKIITKYFQIEYNKKGIPSRCNVFSKSPSLNQCSWLLFQVK